MNKSDIIEWVKNLNKEEIEDLRDYFAREMAFSGMESQNVRHTLADLVKALDALVFYTNKHDTNLQSAIESEAYD